MKEITDPSANSDLGPNNPFVNPEITQPWVAVCTTHGLIASTDTVDEAFSRMSGHLMNNTACDKVYVQDTEGYLQGIESRRVVETRRTRDIRHLGKGSEL